MSDIAMAFPGLFSEEQAPEDSTGCARRRTWSFGM